MEPADVALLIVRVAFGVGLAYHGYNKVAKGLDGAARWFGSIGMRWPVWQARLAAAAEIGTGLGFASGFLTPLTAGGMAATMLVALWTTHRKNGFLITKDGWEYTAAIAVVAWTVAALGPGELSIDHALGLTDTWNGGNWTGAVIAAVVAVVGAVVQLAVSYRDGESFSV